MKTKYLLFLLSQISLFNFASEKPAKKVTTFVWFQNTPHFSQITAIFPATSRVIREDTRKSPSLSTFTRIENEKKKIKELEVETTSAIKREFAELKLRILAHAMNNTQHTNFKIYDDNSIESNE